MDNLRNEVIIKVKEAIRAKLKEMNANSSDEIIDYIMLLVTTKKSSSELAKSIDFVMESNTTVFVKWLSTIIKKLQQVTVSTTNQIVSDNLQSPEESITTDEKKESDNISICETSDIKLNNTVEVKEELNSSVDNGNNIQTSSREKLQNCLPELNVSKSEKYDENTISSPSDKVKPKISFSPTEAIKSKHNMLINKKSIVKPLQKNHPTIFINPGVVSKQSINNDNETVDSKRKRPRISINSDNEDEKTGTSKAKLPITCKETTKQIVKELPKKINKKTMSQVIVVKNHCKNNFNETRKKLNMHDLIAQRVDHQRGALALDTAFKYIQQQIGASEKEIAVVKKWRDYAVDMLRPNKNE